MKILSLLTPLFSGLVAGLFYAYSCSVNPGLKSLKDAHYLKSMQSINEAIQNPMFFTTFLGLLVLLPLTTVKAYPNADWRLMGLATLLYGIGVFGVTVFFNVPLNEKLAAFSVGTATDTELSLMRSAFEKPWNWYHSIRTICSIVCFGLTLVFLMKQRL